MGLADADCGGRYKFNAISQLVVEALWVSLRSFPPNDAIEAVVLKVDILGHASRVLLLTEKRDVGIN